MDAHVWQERLDVFGERRGEQGGNDDADQRERHADRSLPIADGGERYQHTHSQNPDGHAHQLKTIWKKSTLKI